MSRAITMQGMSSELKKMRADVRKQLRQTMRQLSVETAVTAKGIFGHYQEGQVNWAQLSPFTLNKSSRRQQLAAAGHSGDSPLLVTGALRDSVEHAYGWDWAAAGTNSEIMAIQEFGGPNPMQGAADIPPRPVFEPTAYMMYHKLPEIIRKNFNVVFSGSGGSVKVSSMTAGTSSASGEEDDGGEY